MSVSELSGLHPDALKARLGRRSWLGMAAGVFASGLILGSLGWVIAGWIRLPRDWSLYCGGAMLLFAALEIGVQRRSRARLGPVLDLLVECVRHLPADDIGHHRGLPWIAGERGGRRFTALVEWDGGERLRLGLNVHAELSTGLRLVPAEAADRPDRWMTRLRVKHRHRELSDMPAGLIGLSAEPEKAERLWADAPLLVAEARALTGLLLPRAAVLDMQPDGVGWDGPLDDERLDRPQVHGVLDRLVALADHLEALDAPSVAEPSAGEEAAIDDGADSPAR